MKTERTYRIKEQNGKFTIEVYGYYLKGLFRRIKIWDWYDTNLNGGVMQSRAPMEFHSPSFDTSEDAAAQIKKWNANPVHSAV